MGAALSVQGLLCRGEAAPTCLQAVRAPHRVILKENCSSSGQFSLSVHVAATREHLSPGINGKQDLKPAFLATAGVDFISVTVLGSANLLRNTAL